MIDVDLIRREIHALTAAHPDLQDDDLDWLLSLESETSAIDALRKIERERQQAEAFAAALVQTIDNMEERRDRFKWREERMRDLAFKIMQAANLKALPMPEATYSVRTGPRKVLITDEASIPDNLCRFKREPNRADIRELLKVGEHVPGACLSNAEEVLSVRVK